MSVRRLFHDFVYRDDKSSANYKTATLSPAVALGRDRTVIEKETEHVYQVSKLANGVTVLTESASSPSRVDVGVLLDVGTRDETSETSGSLLSMKNTYLKTVMNTNETIN
jgi:processing peptidase subunit beta